MGEFVLISGGLISAGIGLIAVVLEVASARCRLNAVNKRLDELIEHLAKQEGGE